MRIGVVLDYGVVTCRCRPRGVKSTVFLSAGLTACCRGNRIGATLLVPVDLAKFLLILSSFVASRVCVGFMFRLHFFP